MRSLADRRIELVARLAQIGQEISAIDERDDTSDAERLRLLFEVRRSLQRDFLKTDSNADAAVANR